MDDNLHRMASLVQRIAVAPLEYLQTGEYDDELEPFLYGFDLSMQFRQLTVEYEHQMVTFGDWLSQLHYGESQIPDYLHSSHVVRILCYGDNSADMLNKLFACYLGDVAAGIYRPSRVYENRQADKRRSREENPQSDTLDPLELVELLCQRPGLFVRYPKIIAVLALLEGMDQEDRDFNGLGRSDSDLGKFKAWLAQQNASQFRPKAVSAADHGTGVWSEGWAPILTMGTSDDVKIATIGRMLSVYHDRVPLQP